MSERPRGLRLVSTLQVIGAIAAVIIAAIGFVFAIFITNQFMTDPSIPESSRIMYARLIRFFTTAGVILLIVGILGCVAAYGLWNLKSWGFYASISVNGLIIPIWLWIGDTLFVEVLVGSPLRPNIWVMIASVLWIPIVFLVYLFFVREHFK